MNIRIHICLASMLMASTGCRLAGVSSTLNSVVDRAERIEIVYTSLSSNGSLFLPAIPNASPTTVNGVEEASAIIWSKAEVTVTWPHPVKGEAEALVAVRYVPIRCGQQCDDLSLPELRQLKFNRRGHRRDRRQGRYNPFGRYRVETEEIMAACSVSSKDVHQFVQTLSRNGFFKDREPQSHNTNFEVRIDQQWQVRSWTTEPQLEHWMSLAESQPKSEFRAELAALKAIEDVPQLPFIAQRQQKEHRDRYLVRAETEANTPSQESLLTRLLGYLTIGGGVAESPRAPND